MAKSPVPPRPIAAFGIDERLAMSLLLGLAVVLRMPRFDESLWYDELWSTHVFLGSIGDFVRTNLVETHPPLYPVFAFLWIHVFGDSEIAVRALPLLCGLATIALMPRVGELLASRAAGWIGALMLAMSPVHIWYSQEARPYAMIMLASVLLPLSWHAIERKPTGPWAAMWYIALCVGLGQLHYYLVVLPFIYVLLALVSRQHIRTALAGAILNVACLAGVIAFKLVFGELATENPYLSAFDLAALRDLVIRWFLLGNSVSFDPAQVNPPGTALLGVLLAVVALAGFAAWLVNALRERSWRSLELAMLLLAMPALMVVFQLLGRKHFYIERSALTSLPFFVLAVGAGIAAMSRAAARRILMAATTIGMAGVLVAFYSGSDQWTVYKPNPDWRGAASSLQQVLDSTRESIVVLNTTPLTELTYYLPTAAQCGWPAGSPAMHELPTWIRPTIARHFRGTGRPTCGPDGTARVRAYFVARGNPQWARDVLAYETGSRAVVALNQYWLGETRILLDSLLLGTDIRVERTERVKGVELAYLARR